MDPTSRGTFLARVGASLSLVQRAGAGPSLTTLRDAPWRVEALDGADVTGLKLERPWSQEFCKPKLVNAGTHPVRVKQVVLFTISHGLPPDTHLYGESFQMLSQTAGGTLAKPVNLGYSEPKHYKIPQPEGGESFQMLSQTAGTLAKPMDLGYSELKHYKIPQPDGVTALSGLLTLGGSVTGSPASVAARINRNHPPRGVFSAPPTGWCSW